MSKEEIEKEARNFASVYAHEYAIDDNNFDSVHQASKEGYKNGAEPREKRIEELEQKLEQTEKDLADYQFNYPSIKELSKENAEIDVKRKAERQIFQGIVEKKNEQLTKATELLRFWVDDFYDSFKHSNKYEARHKALVETEQFLKEIEK